MKDIINNLKNSDTWKIQLTIATNFIYSKDTDEEHTTHSKSYKIEVMIYDKVDEVTENALNHLFTDIKLDRNINERL